jgi:hypothetical protein
VQDEATAKAPQCAECTENVAPGEEVTLRLWGRHGTPLVLCADCAATLEARYQAETEQPELLHGALLGLILGFLGAILWFLILVSTGWELGFLSLGLGYLVGWGVMRGAGRKRGRKLQWLAVADTLVVMVFTQYLIGRHFISRLLVEDGYPPPPVFLPPDLMLAVLVATLWNLTTLALWGFAFLVAWTVPRRRHLLRA